MMKNITFVFAASLIASPAFANSKSCETVVNQSAGVIQDNPSRNGINFEKLTKKMADFIKEKGRSPSLEELSEISKIDIERLKTYFGRSSSPQILEIIASAKMQRPEVFEQYEREYAEEAMRFLKKNNFLPTDSQMAEALEVSVGDVKAIYGAAKGALARIREYESEALLKYMDKILAAYTKIAKEKGKNPLPEELAAELSISTEVLMTMFGRNKLFVSFDALFDLAAKRKPNIFKGITNVNIFTPERLANTVAAIRDGNGIILTGAVAGAPVEDGMLRALKTYHRATGIPTIVSPVNLESTGLQPELLDQAANPHVHTTINTIWLTPKMAIDNDTRVLAKQIIPETGQDNINQGITRIFPSIQRRLLTRVTPDNSIEQEFIITTGVVTKPNYRGVKIIKERTGEIATKNHFNGGIILEKDSSRGDFDVPGLGRYHIRAFEFVSEIIDDTGEKVKLSDPYIMDMNKLYFASGRVETIRLESFHYGDLHVPSTDQRALRASLRIIDLLQPKRITVEDDFDGKEINHHEKANSILNAVLARTGGNNLEEGLHKLRQNLEGLLRRIPKDAKIYRKRSNHPHWVVRYLEKADFPKDDRVNAVLGYELSSAMAQGMDPIDYFLKKYMTKEDYARVVTLEPGETQYEGTRPVLTSAHGDKGISGARGSINSVRKYVVASIFGHTHTLQMINRILNIGSMVENPQAYNREGMNRLVIANGGIGPNGEVQFYIYDRFSQQFSRDWSQPLDPPEDFFAPGYPLAIPVNDPTANNPAPEPIGSRDQYSR